MDKEKFLTWIKEIADRLLESGIDPADLAVTVAFAIIWARGLSAEAAKEHYLQVIDKIEAFGELPMEFD